VSGISFRVETPSDLQSFDKRPLIVPEGVSDDDAFREHSEVELQTIGFEEFPPDLNCVGEVRRFVRRTLDAVGISDDRIFECQLVADELATNSVCHAGTAFSVAVELTDTFIRIAVRDDSSAEPVRRDPNVEATSGRGLMLVSGTSQSWGMVPLGVGKETWADVKSSAV
jgi:anti-sigma regulatory factor (Ser/Thr protein kinase)